MCIRDSDWNDAMMKTSAYDADPMWTVMREGGPEHCRGHLQEMCIRDRGYYEKERS